MGKYFKIINRIRGGNALWSNSSPASVILNNDFFGIASVSSVTVTPINGVITIAGFVTTI